MPAIKPPFTRYLLIVLLAASVCLQACAYGIYDDKRLIDTQASDTAMAADIKTALLRANFTEAMGISVYCFYDHVFLIGEVPQDMQAKAIAIARSYKPRSVTPHWFAKARGERSNLMLATDLRAALIGTRGLSSTRIDTVVNSGRVVLLGVVHDNAEKQLAIQAARQVNGVTSVTSYLMLPQKAG